MRTALSLALLFALVTSAACDPAERRLVVDDRERRYLLHTPESAQGPLPLVIVLHGAYTTADQTRRFARFHDLGDAEGFITVFPDAVYDNWSDGRTGSQMRENAEGVDDLAFIDALIDAVDAEVSVDDARVYVTGPSNGGVMTYLIACSPLSDRIAAVAPVIASVAAGVAPECAPTHPLPLLAINGSEDEISPYEGGPVSNGARGELLPVEDALALFTSANGCADSPEATVQDDDPEDDTSLSIRRWNDCSTGAIVEHILVEGGGHSWPGAPETTEAVLGTTSQEIDATTYIWSFFERFSKKDAGG